ncbi:MAG: competence/damage-inducible protein A [Bryobacterales bacterium]|nr:competence/damage-inducible protein A [Bryobacterales bacterium]
MANAEIIAVGSELLTADKIDTNSLWLTDQLNALGVEVRRKLVVGDDRKLLAESIRQSLQNADLVILTGGLGPTEDDVTREATSEALGRGLVFRQDLLDALLERFQRLNRKMADNNRRQTFLIAGAESLPNDRGTAAGQWIDCEGKVLMLLPGPPNELQAMFTGQCAAKLRGKLPVRVIRIRLYRVAGMGESDLDQLISPVYKPYENPVTTILAGAGDIQIHLRAHGETEQEAEALLAAVGSPIEELLGDRIYSRDGSNLETVTGGMLRAGGATLCVAESCSGGLLGGRITSVPGSSDYYLGGFLVYSDAMKTRLLGVDAELLRTHTSVSEEAAKAMATSARARTGSTFALSVTGEAGPESQSGAPVGTVIIGFAGPAGEPEAATYRLFGDRNGVRARAAQWALDYLRRKLR